MGIFKSKEERAAIKAQKKADKELLKEIDREIKEESRKEYEQFIDEMLLGDDEAEKYLESIMTEEERKELIDKQNQQTALTIIASIIFSIVIVVAVVIIFAADYASKSELVKETVPVLKEYYKNMYNQDLKYLNIDYICRNSKSRQDKECSNIAHLITEDNHHIMAIENNVIGDDISTGAIRNAYNDNMRTYLASLDLISNYPILSYKDYYMDYNIHYDFIYALPTSIDYQTMRGTKKLTVTEVIFYKGEFDTNLVRTFVSNFSEDSVFYFVKNTRGIPTNLTIVTPKKIDSFDIKTSFRIDRGIYYELDRNKNAVTGVKIEQVNGADIETKGDYKFVDNYKIVVDEHVPYDKKDTTSTYYFIKLDDVNFNEKNIYQFSVSNYDNNYTELDEEDYTQVITFNNGSGTYLIGTETIGIAHVSVEDSILCKLGLC